MALEEPRETRLSRAGARGGPRAAAGTVAAGTVAAGTVAAGNRGARAVKTVALLLGWLCSAGGAEAAGIEDTEGGAVALGRAASRVSVDDFMATWHNPANLAVIAGGDVGFELRLPMMQACFDRARDNSLRYQDQDPSSSAVAFESFAEVCNEGFALPTGHLGLARSFESGWGFGVGFFTPAAVSTFEYGSDTVLTRFPLDNEQAPITESGIASPNRFLLIERGSIAGWLMAGIGAQPNSALRVGLSAGLGFASIHNQSVASVQGGTFEDQEILLDLRATDRVIPRFMASAVFQPSSELEAMLGLTYQDDIRAKGDLQLRANGFQGVSQRNCRALDTSGGSPRPAPGTNCVIEGAGLHVPMPTLEANLGFRYAKRRNPQARTRDRLRDERWDLELNLYWSQTSTVRQYTVDIYDEEPGTPGAPFLAFSTAPNASVLATPQQSTIRRNWKDTLGVRAGGDFSILPRRWVMRAGVSYESRATPVSTMNIDVWPVAKLGLHLGSTLAIGQLRLHAAYAHVAYQNVVVPVGKGDVREIVSQNPLEVLPVNEGSFRAALNVASVGASWRY